ncbi:sugar transferase [Algoriphagus chordae]|uniref:Putative colanic acid biosynthesis UDP-glucose lipid carrier transferase n=1 Tax=Algoriphagus chordae TaxID=237019 RepID=A0A2W7RMX6_9BACT|nr:sugar transferase [Algoriphagus chordae]PZX52075.1 putative colanic acid biosynthesis UDP-glucose lipid carrier transferase [Algoriphagus chordae]
MKSESIDFHEIFEPYLGQDFYSKECSSNHFNILQVSAKKVFDISFSLLFFLTIGWWLFLLIIIAIRIETPGPPIFKQLRHGRNNKPFFCYKFRSMKYDPARNFQQAHRRDPRITKVGCFLRTTSLDELPQFINVLLGDMSVVGPRPHAIAMNRAYSHEIQKFMNRHYVKPGITGLAQCKGFRGEIRNNYDIRCRIKYDLFYIKKWKFVIDILIIWETVKCILFDNKNAY